MYNMHASQYFPLMERVTVHEVAKIVDKNNRKCLNEMSPQGVTVNQPVGKSVQKPEDQTNREPGV